MHKILITLTIKEMNKQKLMERASAPLKVKKIRRELGHGLIWHPCWWSTPLGYTDLLCPKNPCATVSRDFLAGGL